MAPVSRAAVADRDGRLNRELDLRDVDRLGALGPALLLVRHLRPLRERAIAVPGDAAEVDEQITPAVVWRDEAEALVVAEPLYGSRSHLLPLCCRFGHIGLRSRGPRLAENVAGREDSRTRDGQQLDQWIHLSCCAAAAISSESPGCGFHGSRKGSSS